MRRTTICFAAVMVMQFGGSVGGTAVALTAAYNFRASVWWLGIIGMVQPLMYTAGCLAVGSVVGRIRPLNVALCGIATQGVALAFAATATENWHLMLVNIGAGLGQSMFWPMIEGVISEGTDGARLNRRIGLFNVSWSAADAVATAAGGALMVLRPWLPFVCGAVAMGGTAAVVLAARRRAVDALEPLPKRFTKSELSAEHTKAINGKFRKAAWVANFISAGSVTIVRSLFAAPARDIFRMSGPMTALAFAVLSIMRTVAFAGLREWPGWHYRPAVFVTLNSLLAVGLVALVAAAYLPGGAAVVVVFISMAAMGIAVGMTYYSSIFYAVDTEAVAASTARLHEAVLGAGGALAVLAAGAAGKVTGNASSMAALSPFVMSAVIVAAGLVLSGRHVRGTCGGRKVLELAVESEYSGGRGET